MSYEGGSSKGRLDIQKKPRIKKRLSNQVPTKFPKARDNRVSKPKSKKGRGIAHQARSQFVESVAKIIMVVALLGRTIYLGVERVATR